MDLCMIAVAAAGHAAAALTGVAEQVGAFPALLQSKALLIVAAAATKSCSQRLYFQARFCRGAGAFLSHNEAVIWRQDCHDTCP